jgi:hypothetical protein
MRLCSSKRQPTPALRRSPARCARLIPQIPSAPLVTDQRLVPPIRPAHADAIPPHAPSRRAPDDTTLTRSPFGMRRAPVTGRAHDTPRGLSRPCPSTCLEGHGATCASVRRRRRWRRIRAAHLCVTGWRCRTHRRTHPPQTRASHGRAGSLRTTTRPPSWPSHQTSSRETLHVASSSSPSTASLASPSG